MVKTKEKKKRKWGREPNPRQVSLLKIVSDNLGKGKALPMQTAMIQAGYSPSYAATPSQLVSTESFKDLQNRLLPQSLVVETHRGLMTASRLDHAVFPLEVPELTDDHIIELLAAVNCTVKKIVHGETSRHVYFWSADNRARKDAVDMAYKNRGSYDNTVTVKHGLALNTDEEIDRELAGTIAILSEGIGAAKRERSKDPK